MVCDANNFQLAQEVASERYGLLEFDTCPQEPGDAFPAIRPDDMAFFFYTSGSTGMPKGVVHHHRVMLHNVMLRTNSGHVRQHDRMAAPRSGTSAAVANLLVAILNGATLYPFEFRKEGAARLADCLDREEISLCTLSVPLFRSLTEVVQQPSLPKMRLLWVTSQAVRNSDVAVFKAMLFHRLLSRQSIELERKRSTGRILDES